MRGFVGDCRHALRLYSRTRGFEIEEHQADGERVVVISHAFWQQRFGGRDDVLGRTIAIENRGGVGFVPRGAQQEPEGPAEFRIIGVMDERLPGTYRPDAQTSFPAAEVEPMAFMTSGIDSTRGLAVVASSMTPADLRQALQGLIDAGALELTIRDVSTLKALRSETIASDRARAILTFGAAALVVLLAAVGFYGTQGYLVAAGRREYAVRSSVGAGPRALGRLVLWHGLVLGLPGLVLSLPLALLVVAWLRDDYISRGTSPLAVSIAVAVGLGALVIAASLGPAGQARRTQPAPLLREE